MTKPLRIAFMGTPDFALEALKAIHKETDHEVAAVFTQPPRPKGRGHKMQVTPVDDYASRNDIPVCTPKSLKSTEEQDKFAALNLDVAIVAAYGLILPKAILEAPQHGCINIHASLLPRWRGASPIQHAIWHGDKETGVTLMQMDEGLDTGPMIAKGVIPIDEKNTYAGALHDEMATLGGEMIVKFLDNLAKNKSFETQEQDNSQSNYAPLLSKADGKIDWSKSAEEIHRQIRALNPWPGTWCETENGERIKIIKASLSDESSDQSPGAIVNDEGHIQCGEKSVLKLKMIQPAGSRAMTFSDALNGNYVEIGQKLI